MLVEISGARSTRHNYDFLFFEKYGLIAFFWVLRQLRNSKTRLYQRCDIYFWVQSTKVLARLILFLCDISPEDPFFMLQNLNLLEGDGHYKKTRNNS